MRAHQRLEGLAARLEIRELVETRAGRRKQYGLALLRLRESPRHRDIERSAHLMRHLAERPRELLCRRADQVGLRHPPEERPQALDPARLRLPAHDPAHAFERAE